MKVPVWQNVESTSLAKRSAIHSLALQGRRYKVVYHSSSLVGQIAAVESGLAWTF